MTPLEFLNQLWQEKPEDHHILIWTQPDKRSRWFTSVASAAEYVGSVNGGRDVYVGVGLAGKDHGPTHRCASEEITGLTGMWSDLDLLSDAHSKKALPQTVQQALTILPASMPPTIIIATGNGLHCWWLFKEPYIFDGEEDRMDVARVVTRWHTMLQLTAATHGWAYDRLSDLARVLRLPSTTNFKDGAHPKPVEIYSFTDRRYNISDFEEFLDDAAIPDPEADEKASRQWAERFADKPLVIDLNARIPDDVIEAWANCGDVAGMRFRNTWNRQRHDLKDQSQSGYDLALACFGLDASLSEAQIVDLIIHHRHLHGQRPRTRVDYFQRTITKAARRVQGIDPFAAPLGTPGVPAPALPAPPGSAQTGPSGEQGASGAPENGQPKQNATLDPARARAKLCEKVSQVLGIRVLRLIKITGKEPQYRMELAEGKIEFPSVVKLISQDAVRVAIAATVGRLIVKLKPKHWDQLAQMLLDACQIEEGTEEVEWEGAARMYLQHYLSETGFIPSVEDQRIQDQRRPMVIDGKITVCAGDLQVYVNKTTFQALSVKAVAGMLSALGAKSMRHRGAKFKEQSRWVLPEEFDPADYSTNKESRHE
jgi:hypothetical protein